jgi:GNAT superfamily N-acetyltransferase
MSSPDLATAYPIRRATIADAPALARLRWDFSPEEIAASGSTFEPFRDAFIRFLDDALASGAWTIWVAEDAGGAIVANMYIQRVAKVPRPGRFGHAWGYVTNVYVAPEHRNHGLGARLLAAVVAWARAQRLEHLALWPSAEAVTFYHRAGFAASDLLELDLGQ